MFLGIDIGTSGVKAVAIDRDGTIAAQATAALTVQRPHPLWSEQDPDAWWQATDAAVRALPADVRRAVRGVGLAGQMHGATLLGADDRPLRPAILWNDGRSFAECEELERAAPGLRDIAANIAMPGFTAPKLLWVRHHEPETFAAIRTVLLPKDHVRLVMTGEKASDVSDAAGTLWLDVARRDWSDELLAATGLTRAQMPRAVEGSDATGALRREIADRWGMDAVPVAGGGGDNAAGAAGIGVVRDGDALLSLGTSGVIFVATDRLRANPAAAVHAFCHCLPGMWHQMAVHLSAAVCVDWVARLIGVAGAADVFARAEMAGPAGGPELFLPYLSGERTPHNDAGARGGFAGLSQSDGPAEMARAVMEGVAYAFADCQRVLADAGTDFASALAVGGGARSDTWLRIIAAVLNRPLRIAADSDVGAALGAARLAICAAEGADPAEVCTQPEIHRTIEPEPALVARYAEGYGRYRRMYPALREILA